MRPEAVHSCARKNESDDQDLRHHSKQQQNFDSAYSGTRKCTARLWNDWKGRCHAASAPNVNDPWKMRMLWCKRHWAMEEECNSACQQSPMHMLTGTMLGDNSTVIITGSRAQTSLESCFFLSRSAMAYSYIGVKSHFFKSLITWFLPST